MQPRFIPAFLLTFVNVLGFSLLIPVLPFVVEQYGSSETVYGLLLSLYSLCQFLAAPWLGRLSDSYGRKPILMVSQAGTLLSWLFFSLAWFIPDISLGLISLPLVVIAISRISDGLTGGNMAVTQAYVSDITTHEEKGWIFGTMGGVSGIGMIVGPGVGGYLASGEIGYLGAGIAGATISAITLLSIKTNLHESLPQEKRRPYKAEPLSHSIRLLHRIKTLNPPAIIKRLFLVRSLFACMMASYVGTIVLYVLDLFEFDQATLGFFMFVVGFFLAFNQAFLSKRFIKRFGELMTLRIGLFICAIGFIAITLSKTLWIYVIFYYVLNLGISLSIPTFNALIAQNAEPQTSGEVMGINNSIISLANALLPVLAATLYGIIGEKFYHLLAVLPLIGLLLAFGLRAPEPTPQKAT